MHIESLKSLRASFNDSFLIYCCAKPVFAFTKKKLVDQTKPNFLPAFSLGDCVISN